MNIENLGTLLKKSEVAKLIGVHECTIYRMERRGEFPRSIKLGPKLIRYRTTQVLEWLNSREETMTYFAA